MINGLCIILGLSCAVADVPPREDIHMPMEVSKVSAPSAPIAAIEAPKIRPPSRFPASCEVQPPEDMAQVFYAAALRYPGATACELAKQGWCESNFNTTAVSPAGAKGVPQFLDGTAKEMGVRDSFDYMQAIPAMARYVNWTRGAWSTDGRTREDLIGLGGCGYNFGRTACYRNQKKHGWYLLWEAVPNLPHETQGYIPCILKGSRK